MIPHILTHVTFAVLSSLGPTLAEGRISPAEESVSSSANPVELMGLGEMVMHSGVTGWMVAVLTASGILLAVTLFLQIRMKSLAPVELQRALESAVQGNDAKGATRLAAASPSFLGTVACAGLRMHGLGLDEMLANIERAAGKATMRIGNRLANLSRLGGSTLLFGFLGSSLGYLMILQMSATIPESEAHNYMPGFAIALSPIALSLMGAILCYSAFFLLDYRLTHRAIMVREIAEEMAYMVAERKSSDSDS